MHCRASQAHNSHKPFQAFTSLWKAVKSCSQACCKLAKDWLAYARLTFYNPAASLRQAIFKLVTSHLQACDKPSTSLRQASYKLATSLLQACDKPGASRFEQVNFRLYCIIYSGLILFWRNSSCGIYSGILKHENILEFTFKKQFWN